MLLTLGGTIRRATVDLDHKADGHVPATIITTSSTAGEHPNTSIISSADGTVPRRSSYLCSVRQLLGADDGSPATSGGQLTHPRAANSMLALLSQNELLRKHTNTDVAFTLEYSIVSNPRGTIKRDQT